MLSILKRNYKCISGDGDETEEGLERSASASVNQEEHGEQSHLIVWQVQSPLPSSMNV